MINVAQERVLWELNCHIGKVLTLSGCDGQFLFSGGSDCNIVAIKFNGDEQPLEKKIFGHEAAVSTLVHVSVSGVLHDEHVI